MKKVWLMYLGIITIFFTGCGPQIITVPTLPSNIDIGYKTKEKTSEGKKQLYVYLVPALLDPLNINIDNKVFNQLSKNTYAYYELNEGRHWIKVSRGENSSRNSSSFVCLNSNKESQLIYTADLTFGSAILKKVTSEIMADEDLKQIIQNTKEINTNFANTIIKTISVESVESDKNLFQIKENIEKVLNKEMVDKGNGLVIRISILSNKEGNQFGRYLLAGLSSAKDFETAIKVKTEFLINGKLVDELISFRNVPGGIFGGFSSHIYPEIGEEIASYALCKYTNK